MNNVIQIADAASKRSDAAWAAMKELVMGSKQKWLAGFIYADAGDAWAGVTARDAKAVRAAALACIAHANKLLELADELAPPECSPHRRSKHGGDVA